MSIISCSPNEVTEQRKARIAFMLPNSPSGQLISAAGFAMPAKRVSSL